MRLLFLPALQIPSHVCSAGKGLPLIFAWREEAVFFCHLHWRGCLWAAASRIAALAGNIGNWIFFFFFTPPPPRKWQLIEMETWPRNTYFQENVSGNGFSYENEREGDSR